MSDDPARTESVEGSASGAPLALAQPYVQITEVESGLVGAATLLEQRDAYGRVPLIARIRAQAPIQPVWVLIAIGLAASGIWLPLAEALRAIIIVVAVVALIVGLAARIFVRIPVGAVGVVTRAGRPAGVLQEGVHRVNPLRMLVLTHLVSTRQLAFDVPVVQSRSTDGVGVTVDTLLTLVVTDAEKLVRSISTGDLDQLVHATCQDAVRKLIRGMEALATLDLGADDGDRLRAIIDERLATFGLNVPSVAITNVTLPAELTASLEARRLASVKLAEQVEQTALDQRRITDQARLEAEEQEGRRAAVEKAAAVESVRLARLQERLEAYPTAAQYDMQLARLRVAEQAAGNTRAIVSLGGPDVGGNLLLAPELESEPVAAASSVPAGDEDAAASAAPEAPARMARGRRGSTA